MSEEKAHQREDILKDQIRHLVSRLKVGGDLERVNCAMFVILLSGVGKKESKYISAELL